MVDPPLLPQLGHYGVNPWETSPALSPLCQGFGIPVPRDLHADGIELHFVKVWVVSGSRVEELTPEQLTVKGQWWDAVLLDLRSKSQEKKSMRITCQPLTILQSITTMMNSALNVRVRQCCTLYLSVEVCEFEIEKSAGQAAKPEVRAQACGAG